MGHCFDFYLSVHLPEMWGLVGEEEGSHFYL